jgi:catechol 2,3-dioxygenase-like lactoylglutathione lyase family enzyme
VRVNRLDHLVLTVASIEATVEFYTRVLGMDAVTFGAGRTALVPRQQCHQGLKRTQLPLRACGASRQGVAAKAPVTKGVQSRRS